MNLGDFWSALCPSLPEAWNSAAPRLAAIAETLPPIPRVALECRLGDTAPQIDVQQCIRRDDGGPELLRRFILGTQTPSSEWNRLADFCKQWSDEGSPLHRGIDEVFLEFDLDNPDVQGLTPSIFFSVRDRESPNVLVRTALEILAPDMTWWANIERCIAACPSGAAVSYVGLMLGRSPSIVRINVRGMRLDDIAPYLDAVGWPTSSDTALKWATWAYDRVDRVVLCLDVGDVVFPRLGLECVVDAAPTDDPRWHATLTEPALAHCVRPDNVTRFLSVPGVLTPASTKFWPVPWIAESLSAPDDRLSSAVRRLSHFKLTSTGENLQVKGYWG